MINPIRFRIRTILIFTAVVASLIVFVPKLLLRYRVSSALDIAIHEGPPKRIWDTEFMYLALDTPYVLEQLTTVIATDSNIRLRTNSVSTLQLLGERQEFREKALSDVIAITCETPNDPVTKQGLLKCLAMWIPTVGITESQRKRLEDSAAQDLTNQQYPSKIGWISVLVAIGGKEELRLLERYFETLAPADKGVACIKLRRQLSEEFLTYVDRWMLDPDCTNEALELDVLSLTGDGRTKLIRTAKDVEQDPGYRFKAIEQLQATTAGIDELLSACADQTVAGDLSAVLGKDILASCVSERTAILNSQYGDGLWTELIDGLDPEYYENTPLEPAIARAKMSLDLLQRLYGDRQVFDQVSWRRRQSENPKVTNLKEILEAVLERPELLSNSAVLRRMVPYHLAKIPDDCLPLYEQMLRSQNSALKYWSCKAILHFNDSPEAIDVAIDLIEEDKRNRNHKTTARSGPIALLQDRFGVNYFWEMDAWRAWAKARRDKGR